MAKINIKEKKALAKSLFDKNDLEGAKKHYITICNQKPDADSLYMLGIVFGMTNDFSNAEKAFIKTTKITPGNDLAWSNLAIAQLKQRKHEQAIKSLKKAISLNPLNAHAMNSLGNTYRETGKAKKAEEYFNRAIKIEPNNPATQTNIGNIYLDRCLYDKAIEHYKKALQFNPDYFDARYNLGSAYQSSGQHDDAIEAYRQAQRLNPTATQPISAIANSYEKQGKNEEARDILKPLVDKGNKSPDIITMYSRICLNLKEYEEGINASIQCLEEAQLSPIDEQELRFCLGELYDKQKNYKEAFKQFESANKLRPYTYNSKNLEQYFKNIATHYKSVNLIPATSPARNSTSPIFVLGMPRSGTSLIEQILSSHNQVFGAGELPLIGEIIEKIKASKDSFTYPDDINAINENDLDLFADYYLKKSRENIDSSIYVIDKMPHNFMHIGLLFMLFPKCKVIHCMRDPIDVCLSIYFHNFNSNHPYSDNLKNLGHYYNQYRELMSYWSNSKATDIFEISYEALLSNPDSNVKQMLDFLDLEWQDSCMKFYENKRTVSTPSYTQVRQPLYKSSMKRWMNYENDISELKNAIRKDYLL